MFFVTGRFAIRSLRVRGRLVSGARRRVQHGARDRHRPERRGVDENGEAPEHRRGQRQRRKDRSVDFYRSTSNRWRRRHFFLGRANRGSIYIVYMY